MTEREKMLAGALYDPADPELAALRARAQRLLREYNATVVGDAARWPILDALLGSHGRPAIRAPFHVDYGAHVHIAAGAFLNFGCVILDVCEVRIGARAQLGPHVQLLAADHPRDPAARAAGRENGAPVTLGADCWIGGGAVILPGVTVGDGATVGANAVVTRDVPAGATVAGIPARLIARPAGHS